MTYKMDARPFSDGGSESSRQAKKYAKKKAEVVSQEEQKFNGVLRLDVAAYERFEACMMNPGEPTQSIKDGAEQLRQLYSKKS